MWKNLVKKITVKKDDMFHFNTLFKKNHQKEQNPWEKMQDIVYSWNNLKSENYKKTCCIPRKYFLKTIVFCYTRNTLRIYWATV